MSGPEQPENGASALPNEKTYPEPEAYEGNDASDEGAAIREMRRMSKAASEADAARLAARQREEEAESKADSENVWKLLWTQARPGFVLDHLDYESFKTWSRTAIVGSIGSILYCIHPVARWMGNACFLVGIICCMLAPGGWPWILGTLMTLVSFFYIIFAWGAATAAMAIGWRIRGKPLLQDAIRELVSLGICENDPTTLSLCLQKSIYSGHFLDVRVTVVYIFTFLFVYVFFGCLRKYSLVNVLAFIVGSISLTIQCAYGPLFPYFNTTSLGYTILKPMSVAFALVLVSCFVIFPVTASFKYHEGVSKVLMLTAKTVGTEVEFLKSLRYSTPDSEFQKYKQIGPVRKEGVQIISQLDLFVGLVKLELSYGRLDIGDTGEIRSIMRRLVGFSMSFDLFYSNLQEKKDLAREKREAFDPKRRESNFTIDPESNSKIYLMLHQDYKPVGTFEETQRKHHLKHFLNNDTNSRFTLPSDDVDLVLEIVKDLYLEFMEVFLESIKVCAAWLSTANKFRIYSWFFTWNKHVEQQKAVHEKLVATRNRLFELNNSLKQRETDMLKKIYRENPKIIMNLTSSGSLYGFLCHQNATLALRLMDLMLSVDGRRPTPKFILPFSKSQYQTSSCGFSEDDDALGKITEDQSSFYRSSTVKKRNPDAAPPRHFYELTGQILRSFAAFIDRSAMLVFLKFGIMGVCAMIPIYCRTTAFWYFSHRLIWVPVMAIFSATPYFAENYFSFITKLFYTFLACIVGMVAWYISRGNSYGVAAVCCVTFIWTGFYRHFSVHVSPVSPIIFTITVQLVIGTSWVDQIIPRFSHVGTGFDVAWLRFVSVITGLTLALIVGIIPKPKTAKAAIRKLCGDTLTSIGTFHCDVGKFAFQRAQNKSVRIALRKDYVEDQSRKALTRLASVNPLIDYLRFEPPLSGVWPKTKYVRLLGLQNELLVLYIGLYHVFDQLEEPAKSVPIMSARFGWSDARLSADFFSIVYMASAALRTKSPLPRISHGHMAFQHLNLLKERLGLYYSNAEQQQEEEGQPQEEAVDYKNPAQDASEQSFLDDGTDSGGSGINVTPYLANIDQDAFFGNDGRLHTVGMILVHMIYVRLDEILYIVKSLVGEEFDQDILMYMNYADLEKQCLLQRW